MSVYSYTDLRRNKAAAGRSVPFKKFVTENAHPGQGVFSKGSLYEKTLISNCRFQFKSLLSFFWGGKIKNDSIRGEDHAKQHFLPIAQPVAYLLQKAVHETKLVAQAFALKTMQDDCEPLLPHPSILRRVHCSQPFF